MNLFLKTKDYAVSGEEFELVHDAGLDMLITEPRPRQLEKYYESEDYISHTDAKRNLAEHLYHLVKKYNLKRKVALANRYVQNKKTLLDVGAGTADFISSASKAGWAVEGIEPSKKARLKALEKNFELLPKMDNVGNKKFQLITLWHVLEHLTDLEKQIEKLAALLEENGTLIIAVPNFKSFDAKYYQKFWAGYDVPRHLWHFSKSSVSKLFAKQNMRVVKTKPMLFDAFYVSLLSEKYKRGKAHWGMALYVGLRSNISAWRTKEYSSLIYVLQKA